MKKLLKRLKSRKNANNSGMTLVEVLVATTIFAILTSMVMVVFYGALREQRRTERWNDQTDMQTTYLSDNRQDKTDGVFEGGETNYNMQIVFDDANVIDSGKQVEMYTVDTQQNDPNISVDKDIHIGFFRVS